MRSAFPKLLALSIVSALTLAACSDTPIPSAPESQPEQAPQFSVTASSVGYTAIDLGTLGGTSNLGQSSWGYGMNDAGQVVGSSLPTTSSESHAFLWDAVNGMQDLGTLGGASSRARSINNAGQVVGSSWYAGWLSSHAFLWDAVNGMQDLGTLGGSHSSGYDINEAGQVVGTSRYTYSSNRSHAFLWDAVNGMQDLGTLGGRNSYANAMNNVGQVVGMSLTDSGEQRAFLWDAVNGMQDLGTLGGDRSSASGINDAGQVVGTSTLPIPSEGGRYHRAFLWDAVNGMQDLGTPGGLHSSGYDINEAGQVVGETSPPSSVSKGAVWDAANGWQVLGNLRGDPYGYGYGSAINEAGQVVGTSRNALDDPHATLYLVLTPLEKLEECATMASDLEAQGVLNKGQAHSFVNKINLATAMLNDGKSTPAINKLEAFQNEASGYVNGGNLTAEQGDELIACVLPVIDALGS